MEIFTFRQGFFILKRCWLSNFHERMDPLYGSSAQGVHSMSLLIFESRDLWVCDLNIIFYSLNIVRQSTFPLCNKRTGTWCTTINLYQIFFSVTQHFYSRKTTLPFGLSLLDNRLSLTFKNPLLMLGVLCYFRWAEAAFFKYNKWFIFRCMKNSFAI